MIVTTNPIQYWILAFDRQESKQIGVYPFGEDSQSALDAYDQMEREHLDQKHIDIVLVGSTSLDDVKVTHGTYFDDFRMPTIDDLMPDISKA